MADQVRKLPPALVVVDGDLFHEFDRWRTLQGHSLTPLDGTDGWILRLMRHSTAAELRGDIQ